MTSKPKLLLHVCCGPCSTQSIEEASENYEVILFFSNSNIFPEEEYKKRLDETKRFAKLKNLELIEDDYDHVSWLEFVKGLENEPEGGKRCEKCFEYNFLRTADYCKKNNLEFFTTTLTISPYKNSGTIFAIGNTIAKQYDLKFVEFDFKKKDGYKKSVELSKKYDLYRQNYCGCEFSLNK